MLALGQTCLCAGRRGGCVHNFGVPLCGDGRLLGQHHIADLAMRTCGQTCLRAGRLDGCIDNFGMPLGGNRGTRHDHLIADRAMRTRGKPGLRAGCRHGSVNDFGMRVTPSCMVDLIAEGGGRDARHFGAAGLRGVPPIKLGTLLGPVGRQRGSHAVGIRAEARTLAAVTDQRHGVGIGRPVPVNRMIARRLNQRGILDFRPAGLCRIPAGKGAAVSLCRRQAVVVFVAVRSVIHHGKGGGRDGAAVCIQRHCVGVGSPLCIEGMVSGSGHLRAARHRRGERLRRIPAGEGIARAGGRGQRAVCTVVGHGPACGTRAARIVDMEGHGVGLRHGGCRDAYRALDVARRYRNLPVLISILGCRKGAAVYRDGHGRGQAVPGVCRDGRRERRQTRDRRRCSHGAVLPLGRDGIAVVIVAVVDAGQRQAVYRLRRVKTDPPVPRIEHIVLFKGFAACRIVRQRDGKLHRPGMGIAAGRIDAQLGIARHCGAGIRVETVRHTALDQFCKKACTRIRVSIVGDGKGEVEGSCRVGGDGQRHRKRQIGESAERGAGCILDSEAQLIARSNFCGQSPLIPRRFIRVVATRTKIIFEHLLLFCRERIPVNIRDKLAFCQGCRL